MSVQYSLHYKLIGMKDSDSGGSGGGGDDDHTDDADNDDGLSLKHHMQIPLQWA